MLQIGNLAIICAKRADVLMQVYCGVISVHVGQGPNRVSISADWRDNEKIEMIICDLNYGKYTVEEMERKAA